MYLPFGLQLKGVIVGILLAYFVIPWVQSFLMRGRGPVAAGE